jgi:hypothetical protein
MEYKNDPKNFCSEFEQEHSFFHQIESYAELECEITKKFIREDPEMH